MFLAWIFEQMNEMLNKTIKCSVWWSINEKWYTKKGDFINQWKQSYTQKVLIARLVLDKQAKQKLLFRYA
jgi:hypothetical protein